MHRYGLDQLTVEQVISLTKGHEKGMLTEDCIPKVNESRAHIEQVLQGDQAVYGVNTGFGSLYDARIDSSKTGLLQKNLLMSHAVGVGDSIKPILSKMMLITKLHSLSKGFSGIRLEILERILFFIKNDLIPVVPSQGSVGASGDLAPLAHLFLPLIGHGHIWQGKSKRPSKEVMKKYGLEPIELSAKEGLALINGTQFILTHAILGLHKMDYILDLADICGAMSIEAYHGNSSPFHKTLHELRPFDGSIKVAKRMRRILEDSKNLSAAKKNIRIQDPYSLRCIAPVHGASRNALSHLKKMTEIELNSVTDNPIILNAENVISGGNFHGQPLALPLDYGTLACAELGNISDRRCYLLLEGKYGLPKYLVENSGLDSGMMIIQYTTAALTSENKTLCFPASVDSIPTSLGQEDHVSMGSISGRKFHAVIENLEKILAIELIMACQALDFRRSYKFSELVERNYQMVRSRIDHLEKDRLLHSDIECAIEMVKNRDIEVKLR